MMCRFGLMADVPIRRMKPPSARMVLEWGRTRMGPSSIRFNLDCPEVPAESAPDARTCQHWSERIRSKLPGTGSPRDRTSTILLKTLLCIHTNPGQDIHYLAKSTALHPYESNLNISNRLGESAGCATRAFNVQRMHW
jgi:hypothetical protein